MNEKSKRGIDWYKLWLFFMFLACLSVFAFYHKYTLYLKAQELCLRDEKIAVLEKRLADLQESGEISGVLKRIESSLQKKLSNFDNRLAALGSRMLPFFLAWQVDPLNGYISTGTFSSASQITGKLTEGWNHISNRRFDLALIVADEVEAMVPAFPGATMLRYKVARETGDTTAALENAAQLVRTLPADKQMPDVFFFLIGNLSLRNQPQLAEEYAIRALIIWPEDEALRGYVHQILGYIPDTTQKEVKDQ